MSSSPAHPTPIAGLLLFAAAVATWAATAFLPHEWSLVVTPVAILTITLVAVALTGVDARRVLHLNLPSTFDLVMAFPLALSFFVIQDQIAELSHTVSPVSEEVQEILRQLLTAETGAQLASRIVTIGLGAAVAEELLFRGFIQSAFLGRMRRPTAILLTAVLFMSLHPQVIPVLAAGIVLGIVTLATRSILVPIAVHFTNNTIAILLLNWTDLDTLGDPIWVPAAIMAPAVAIFALTGTYYLRRLQPEAEPEPGPGPPTDGEPPRPIRLEDNPVALSEELARIPSGRRRLGWLVATAAIGVGVLVLLGLVSWSMYLVQPKQMNEVGIDALLQHATARLEPGDPERYRRVAQAFAALHALNERDQLEANDLLGVIRDYWALARDGNVTEAEVESLVETIRTLVARKTRPRTL